MRAMLFAAGLGLLTLAAGCTEKIPYDASSGAPAGALGTPAPAGGAAAPTSGAALGPDPGVRPPALPPVRR